jgi:hypothetical protein
MLRDVRLGTDALPTKTAIRHPAARAPASVSPTSRRRDLLAQVIGKSVVIVPVAAVIAFGLWIGYESVAGRGVSVLMAILTSVGSLALTVGLAFVWAARGRGAS